MTVSPTVPLTSFAVNWTHPKGDLQVQLYVPADDLPVQLYVSGAVGGGHPDHTAAEVLGQPGSDTHTAVLLLRDAVQAADADIRLQDPVGHVPEPNVQIALLDAQLGAAWSTATPLPANVQAVWDAAKLVAAPFEGQKGTFVHEPGEAPKPY